MGNSQSAIEELIQGREFAARLRLLPQNSRSGDSSEAGELIDGVLSSFSRPLCLLSSDDASAEADRSLTTNSVFNEPKCETCSGTKMKSASIGTGRLIIEEGGGGGGEGDRRRGGGNGNEGGGRRTWKSWRKKSSQLRTTVNSKTLHDEYSWRKYGQKDILGCKFPRGYFRCTYRNVRGCTATKQVQKSEDDPSVFVITYMGQHSCRESHGSMAKTNFTSLDPSSGPDDDNKRGGGGGGGRNGRGGGGDGGNNMNDATTLKFFDVGAYSQWRLNSRRVKIFVLSMFLGFRRLRLNRSLWNYFRCTHKYHQDCTPTKQIQKSEDDPSVFVITYTGQHCCRDPNIVTNLIVASNSAEPSIISFGSNTSNVTSELTLPSSPLFLKRQECDEDVLSSLTLSTSSSEIFNLPSLYKGPTLGSEQWSLRCSTAMRAQACILLQAVWT